MPRETKGLSETAELTMIEERKCTTKIAKQTAENTSMNGGKTIESTEQQQSSTMNKLRRYQDYQRWQSGP